MHSHLRLSVGSSLALILSLFVGSTPTPADVSHARVIRLSLVQGDVRFTSDLHGKDPLTDNDAIWETAQLNLPIRQGYVLATDAGRAEVEFENGAMAFLDDNTVLEFYDLSLEEGARTTRLVIRQGTATFYVNPERGDYFSVTGGDFTAEAVGKSRFRINNFDNGSTLAVEVGRVNLLRKDAAAQALSKGQSYTIKAGDDESAAVGRLPDDDAFDRWVSGRIDTVTTATSASTQYSSGLYDAGMADLYTYGSWFPVGGYGYGWRPYGVGLGWCPFDNGGWYYDSFFGWGFVGYQPWGWLPYHYGGWIVDPGIGWIWVPGGYGGGVFWRPATGVFVRGHNGLLGVVPAHPLDVRGKTPINLNHGVFEVRGTSVANNAISSASAQDWKVLKSLPKDAPLSTVVSSATAPERFSRSLVSSASGSRVVTLSKDSSIVYDVKEHKFVNTNNPPVERAESEQASNHSAANGEVRRGTAENVQANPPAKTSAAEPPSRSPRTATPPPAPRVGSGERSTPSGGTRSGWGGASSGRSSGGSGTMGSSRPSGGASHPSGGGGRPH